MRGSRQAWIDIAAIGNACCAAAPSMGFLIAARALAGVGGGGLQTGEPESQGNSAEDQSLVPLRATLCHCGYSNVGRILTIEEAIGAYFKVMPISFSGMYPENDPNDADNLQVLAARMSPFRPGTNRQARSSSGWLSE